MAAPPPRSRARSTPFLGCCPPAAVMLLLLLTYPLDLAPTSALPTPRRTRRRMGRPDNYAFLWGDAVTVCALQHALLHDGGERHQIGLGLARAAANRHLPFKSSSAPRCCCRSSFDRAVGDRVLVDLRFAVLDHRALVRLGLISDIDFRAIRECVCDDCGNIWRACCSCHHAASACKRYRFPITKQRA